MDKYQRRNYLRKHDLREKRLPNGKSIIIPDEDKQRVMMLRERQRVLAENQARLAEETAKRHISDNIAINQLARAVELATPEEKAAIARQLLGDELLAALARLKQQEQAS